MHRNIYMLNETAAVHNIHINEAKHYDQSHVN